MNLIKAYRALAIFCLFVLPILSAFNCPSWNEGVGIAGNCYIESSFLRGYAGLFYGLLLLSVFTFFIPLLIYISLSILIIKYGPNIFQIGLDQTKDGSLTVNLLTFIFCKITKNTAHEKRIEKQLRKKLRALNHPITEYSVFTNEDTGYWVPADISDTISKVKSGRFIFFPLNFDIVVNEEKKYIYLVTFLGNKNPNMKRWRHVNT